MKDLLKTIQEKGINLDSAKELPYSLLSIMYDEIIRKEVTHSKIIASLLTPYNNHNYKYTVILCFFNQIDIKDFIPDEVENFKVVTEQFIYGRFIDILITWEEKSQKYAVIIENKLNYAADPKNQLNDYFYGITESYLIKKVVYMTIDPNHSVKHTDIAEDVLKNTIDFGVVKLINWLESSVKILENSENKYHLIYYRDLLKHMFYKHKNLMKAEELLSELNNDEIVKLIELAAIVSSDDWNNAKFCLLEKGMKDKFDKALIFNPYGSYANFFFQPYELWIELWAWDKVIHLYLCSYNKKEFIIVDNKNFKFHLFENDKYYYQNDDILTFNYPQNRVELVKVMVPILNELSQFNDK